jgi:hypothetical protein
MIDNFQPGEEREEEAMNEIREYLEQIRYLLITKQRSKSEACPDICQYLSQNPQLQNEFNHLWRFCDQCPTPN